MGVFDYDEEDQRGCFGLFKRKRGYAVPVVEKLPNARQVSDDEPQAILAGGGGIVPGTDAPVSAVNAGDRRVLVECGKSRMIFPITPTTTPVDLIKSASTTMNEQINVRSAVLLEFFNKVGVQRPLRRYERVRDVLNSWDFDRQNSLLLVDPRTGSSEAELSLAGAPKGIPQEVTFLLHHSQKIGRWDKRFVTLKQDGQITCQKDPDKPKTQVNVCRLSDFDIYMPTAETVRKKIKPPKKNCYAIKSQQKTAMFESTLDYVHFFCTNDRRTADDFYRAVQGWRSWYLVTVMGEGVKALRVDEKTQEMPAVDGNYSKIDAPQSNGHRKMDSMESHYHLGSFRPLLDTNQFEEQPSISDGNLMRSGSKRGAPQRYSSTRAKPQHPPLSLNKPILAEDEPLVNLARRTSVDGQRRSLDAGRANDFAPDGLIGRTLSHRQRNNPAQEGWTNANTLLNDSNNAAARPSTDLPRRQPSVKQTTNLARTSSRREANIQHKRGQSLDLERSNSRSAAPPKPLIDLTPAYQPPPQHAHKGRGHQTTTVGPGNLIEAATSPEDPLNLPLSTDWRGRNGTAAASTRQPRPGTAAKSVHRPAQSTSPEYGAPVTGSGFTGEGLLAESPQGWGGGSRGRGVVDGSRAKGPLVDLGGEGKFEKGSLLDR